MQENNQTPSRDALALFGSHTQRWFRKDVGQPTKVQEEAWPAIASGAHTLVSAPTGTGKTLSAFLVFLDRLMRQAEEGKLQDELYLIYISPLKSLAGDIRENLRRPLEGISREVWEQEGVHTHLPPTLNVAVRTGDTSQKERRQMIKKPPHILITTPESLYLMLSSKSGQNILGTARALIIDELHALIGSKRGAHLMLSIARLDRLCPGPVQRIGLSATIEPLEQAAEYLSPEPVIIAAPKMQKAVSIVITSPMPQERFLTEGSIWPSIAQLVYDHCKGARSVIAFVEGRLFAEKLAHYVNQIGGDGFARTHHGSLSKERRLSVEESLRNGSLRLLCATSSMELGIDVGEIDCVLQVGCPMSISSTMQRLGRAGHNPGRTSVMHMFPKTDAEGLYCGLTAAVAQSGGIEHSRPPRLCLDVLSQHLVSMAVCGGYTLEEAMEVLARAYPFREVTRQDVESVLRMLAGDYEHDRDIPVRPRVLYDRIHGRVEGDTYSRMLAVSSGGTIPDRGLYTVKTENGVKVGELEEEFVFESRVGEKFLLGSFAWKIVSIGKDDVTVTSVSTEGARIPFWRWDWYGRDLQTALRFGELFRELSGAMEENRLFEKLSELGLDASAANGAKGFLERQMEETGILPDDRTILLEHFPDEMGDHQMAVHAIYGRKVNQPLALLIQAYARRRNNMEIGVFDDDDGFLFFPLGEEPLPKDLLYGIAPETARPILTALLPKTALFSITFRYNAARALMMGVRRAGRQPLWVQRMRSTEMLDSVIGCEDHPLIRETKRECLEDDWDIDGVEYVLRGIQSGAIRIREVFLDTPSPLSLPLRRIAEGALMYEYTPSTEKIQSASEEALKQVQMIPPAQEQLDRVSRRTRLPEDEKQLHTLLMTEGDLMAGELEVPGAWLDQLAREGRAAYIEPGLWIAKEQETEYKAALEEGDREACLHLVRRALRYRGAQDPQQISLRYFWPEETAKEILDELCARKAVVSSDGLYYHGELYTRAQRATVQTRRKQIRTLPPERFAAMLAGRTETAAPPSGQLEAALKSLCGRPYPPGIWESVLLPARVKGYRPELLDTLLAQGSLFWRMTPEGLCFHLYDEIDWNGEVPAEAQGLEGDEALIYEALQRRGASFSQGLSGAIGGRSPYDVLMSLGEKGLVHADSFVPVRQLLNRKKEEKASLRRKVNARARVLSAGRWEITRPLKEQNMEEQLTAAFARIPLLCRETAQGIPWGAALETLRVWEYTGRVRRGYFIEGLSGAQFVREADFAGTMLALEQPQEQLIWLSAADPAQPWGKYLPHMQERSFMNIPGTAVALKTGIPVAVLERQGQILRVFEEDCLSEALKALDTAFTKGRIYASLKRITIKQYPENACSALEAAGSFLRQMQEYVLYRGY